MNRLGNRLASRRFAEGAQPGIAMFCAGFVALGLGGLFYFFFRSPTILQEALGIGSFHRTAEADVIAGSFPSFIHVFSFSLLTIAAGKLNKPWIFPVCAFWVAANIGSECLQVDSVAHRIPREGTVFGSVSHFARNGTFDWLDVTASIAGGLASGFATGRLTTKQRETANKII